MSDHIPPIAAPPRRKRRREVSLLSALTLVIWISCLAIGGIDLLFPRHEIPPPASRPVAQITELVTVDLSAEVVSAGNTPPRSDQIGAPAAMDTGMMAPALPAVALPSPAIAFQVPVEGPVRLVAPKLAQPGPPPRPATVTPVPAAGPPSPAPVQPVKHLTLDEGNWNGPHPNPEVPDEVKARLVPGQKLGVGTRIFVDEQGRVTNVEISSPSIYPQLNQAVARTIRQEWHTGPGPLRCYEKPFNFDVQE